MSVEMVMSASANRKSGKIALRHYCNRVQPANPYVTTYCDDPSQFDEKLRDLAACAFGGGIQFLPSCTSWLHEVYIKTNQEVGTYRSLEDSSDGFDSAGFRADEKQWVDTFVRIFDSHERDRHEYVLFHDGLGADVKVRRVPYYGTLAGRYRVVKDPKRVGFIKAYYAQQLDGITCSVIA